MTSPSQVFARAGWLGAASMPFLIMAGPARSVTQTHPVAALAIAGLCETLLLAGRFGAKVYATVAARWAERSADYVDRTLLRWASRFERRYRSFLVESIRYIDVKGLATVGFITPQLEDVFVDVGLAYRAPMDVPEGILGDIPTAKLDRFSLSELLGQSKPHVLAVVGAPGSGKTTLLRHTASRICKSKRRRRNLPILLTLRDHTQAIVENPELSLPEMVQHVLTRHGIRSASEWLERRLQAGQCTVLLDGLDEVAELRDRQAVVEWVERSIITYSLNDFVISSRPHGFRSTPVEGAAVLQVRPFTSKQIEQFISGWYLVAERHSGATDGKSARLRAAASTTDLLSRLRTSGGLQALTTNPLLLTMIANVHRYRGALPGTRVELYGEICQVVLWKRQEVKKLATELAGSKKEAVLRRLAFEMMQQRVRDLPRAEVLKHVSPVLKRFSDTVTPDAFLQDMGSIGFLVEREHGLYAFAHQTFQEYLTATHLRENGLVEILSAMVDDSWWRETTLLFAARSDSDPIIEACLRVNTTVALALAFDCVDQESEIAPHLRDRLAALLDAAYLDTTDEGRRRLMTSVILTRRLRDEVQVAADSGALLGSSPIGTDLYHLFMRDTGNPGPDCPLPIEPKPEVAVRGVRSADAAAFIDWVNLITGATPRYSLPRSSDLAAIAAAQFPELRFWVQPSDTGARAPVLWGSAQPDDSRTVSGEYLESQIRRDFGQASGLLRRVLSIRLTLCIEGIKALDRMNASWNAVSQLSGLVIRDMGLLRYLGGDLLSASATEVVLALVEPGEEMAEEFSKVVAELPAARMSLHDREHVAKIRGIALACDLPAKHLGYFFGAPDLGELEFVRDLGGEVDAEASFRIWCDRVMGTVLSTCAQLTFEGSVERSRLLDAFWEICSFKTQDSLRSYVLDIDHVVEDISRLRQRAARSLERIPVSANGPWIRRATERFFELALVILGREQDLGASQARALRFGALFIAQEIRLVDQACAEGIEAVGACALLMQMRRQGHSMATEAILLMAT